MINNGYESRRVRQKFKYKRSYPHISQNQNITLSRLINIKKSPYNNLLPKNHGPPAIIICWYTGKVILMFEHSLVVIDTYNQLIYDVE